MISAYLERLTHSLRSRGARLSYFPPDKKLRRERNLKLGRELGYGLAIWPDEDIDFHLGALYGKFIVIPSLDRTGVVISAKEWVAAVKEGIAWGRRSY